MRFKKTLAAAALIVATSVAPLGVASAADDNGASVLFVATSTSMEFDGSRLTLRNVSPTVTWFLDRPGRDVGDVPIEAFLGNWSDGMNSFSDDPPNVVLNIEGNAGAPIVAKLSNPDFDGQSVSFATEILHGSLPQTGGTTSVVFDDRRCWLISVPKCDYSQ